jgi:hypothetical protein
VPLLSGGTNPSPSQTENDTYQEEITTTPTTTTTTTPIGSPEPVGLQPRAPLVRGDQSLSQPTENEIHQEEITTTTTATPIGSPEPVGFTTTPPATPCGNGDDDGEDCDDGNG